MMQTIKGKMFGIRTDAWTGKEEKVEVEYEIKPWTFRYAAKGDRVLQITRGGVTGYESFIIAANGNPLPEMRERGWCACIGTKNRWDKLEIPAEEMGKVLLEWSNNPT